jgi:small subunit ribosomal protein S2
MAKYKLPKIEEMLDAGVHFGHQLRRWHPKMEPYIFGVKRNVHIIDLEQTEKLLESADTFLYEIAKKGQKIIFVGTKKQSREIIELEAKRCGAMYVTERWVGGTVTNFKTIKKNLDKLIDFIKGREEGRFDKYTKKERLLIDREIEKMNLVYGGIINMKDTPYAIFVIDPKREKTAVHEAKNNKIPVVALIDTNADPTGIDYPIPGNDDAIRSVALIVKSIADAIEEGYKEFAKIGEAKRAELEQQAAAEKISASETAVEPVVTNDDKSAKVVKVEETTNAVKEPVKEKVKKPAKKVAKKA